MSLSVGPLLAEGARTVLYRAASISHATEPRLPRRRGLGARGRRSPLQETKLSNMADADDRHGLLQS
jgi:hypothetical protein